MNCHIDLSPFARPILLEAYAILAACLVGSLFYAIATRMAEGVQKLRALALILAGCMTSYAWGHGMRTASIDAHHGTATVSAAGYEVILDSSTLDWQGQRLASHSDFSHRANGLGDRRLHAGWFRSEAGRRSFMASPVSDAWLIPTNGDFDLILPRSVAGQLQACTGRRLPG